MTAALSAATPAAGAPLLATETPFDWSALVDHARRLASRAYQAPPSTLPAFFNDMSYDRWRHIRFRPSEALWGQTPDSFRAQFFHPGFLYRRPVDIYEVEGGQARQVVFDRSLFSYDLPEAAAEAAAEARGVTGFAGFRVHYPLNKPDVMDELIAFLGASYFRALGRGHRYGLSARGLALNVGVSSGEEFPTFRAFWLQRPRPGVAELTIYALLDSPSVAGAYRMTVVPDDETVVEVEAELFTRRDIRVPGVAPLTSMYLHGPMSMSMQRDFRPAVHDSDGLAIETASGEHIWRPLGNPQSLRISAYGGADPRGFGLMQRQRSFGHYQDIEARYELRPSAWVEPIAPLGDGQVVLFEIPSKREYNDNIIAFWQPDAWKAKSSYRLHYRLHWCDARPPKRVAQVVASRVGAPGHAGVPDGKRGVKFVVDFAGGELARRGADSFQSEATVTKGKLLEPVVVKRNPATKGWRAVVDAEPTSGDPMEIRLRLHDNKPLTETWSYQWKP